MTHVHDRPVAGSCAKGTLWGLMPAGGLLLGAVLASMLLIDLPIPAGRTTEAPPYVSAAERWIEPGAASPTGSPLEAAVVDAARER